MTERYYFYDDQTKIIYHSEEFPENSQNLIYLGTSNNPKPAMAAAVFVKNDKVPMGYRLREL